MSRGQTKGQPQPPPAPTATGALVPDVAVCVFGATPASGNLGVTALTHSLVAGFARRVRRPVITVFDDQPAAGTCTVGVDGRTFTYQCCPAIATRHLEQPDNLWRMRMAGLFRRHGMRALAALREADAVIDVTGGDSFSSLYGRGRFARGALEKRFVLQQHRPLILAPQTIGPFFGPQTSATATELLGAARAIWTRDVESYDLLRSLLGHSYDAERHHLGVDMAFALDSEAPVDLAESTRTWLTDGVDAPVVGVNVSGLLYHDSSERFGLRASYRDVVHGLVERLVRETTARIVLVPHATSAPGQPEHDVEANVAVFEALAPLARGRLTIVEGLHRPEEAKWVIGRCDWFCATRLQAAVAALASGVPCAAIAYSRKTQGVFETCGQEGQVTDARHMATDDVVEQLWRSYRGRDGTKSLLARELPTVLRRAESQMDEIVAICAACRAAANRHAA